MENSFIILIVIGFLAVLTLSAVLFRSKKGKKSGKKGGTDYQSNFILGLMFLPIGLILWQFLDNDGFIGIAALGLTYIVIGLANKDNWGGK